MKFSEIFFIRKLATDKEIGDRPQFLQKGGDARGKKSKARLDKNK